MVRLHSSSLAAALALAAACLASGALAQQPAPLAPSPPSSASLPAAAPASQPSPADRLSVALLTFSPGEHPFLAFGHNALWIHNPRMKGDDVDLVYNYGTFAFGSPTVVSDFFAGELRYWLSLATLAWTLDNYGSEGRSVVAQELSLSFDEADRLERALLLAAQPENSRYPYGYVRDNCSTRLRDALDEATGGLLRASMAGPGQRTFRAQLRQVMADRPALGLALDAALGPAVDRPTERWDETFLPDGLAEALRTITRPAPGPGGAGEAVPFVKREYPLRAAGRSLGARRAQAPDRTGALLTAGGLVGALAAALGARAGADRAARRALGALVLLTGITLGAVGVVLLVLLLTPGAARPLLSGNTTILQASPLAVALAALGWRASRRGAAGVAATTATAALAVSAASLALSLGGLALALSGATPQQNGPFIAFALPLWAGLTLGLLAWRRASRQRRA